MVRHLPIIGFGPNDWQGPWMNRQEILSRLGGRGWPVLYTTGPRHIWELGSKAWTAAPLLGRIDRHDGVLVDTPGRLLSRWQRVGPWDVMVRRRFARRLRRAMACAPGEPFIAFLFDPRFYTYLAALEPRYVLFHIYDYFHFDGDDRDSRAAAAGLEALAKRADLITYAGPMMDQCLPASEWARARLLANGTNAAAFRAGAELPCPEDLARVPARRIGFVGNITPKVDLALVMELARRRPEDHWVFVGFPSFPAGALGADAARLWQDCLARPNIHWLGGKTHDVLPEYAGHMDVHALPYRVDAPGLPWTRYINPLKLYSALATGRPVVSVPLASIKGLAHVVDMAATPEEWAQALDRALASGGVGTPPLRQAVAAQNSWETRIDELESWLSELIGASAIG